LIERVLIDNFRCFVNFEWKPGQLALLMGANGSGKTSVADVVWSLRTIICEESDIRREFSFNSRTRWDKRTAQSFGLDVRRPAGLYKYRLIVDHREDEPSKPRVQLESLHLDDQLLFEFSNGEIQYFRDSGQPGPVIPGRVARSGLGGVGPGKENKKLMEFKRWLTEDVWWFRPDPRAMSQHTDEEADGLDGNLSNFASWYASWLATDLSGVLAYTQAIRAVFPGFESLQVGKNAPTLQAKFEVGGQKFTVDFSELSDGQRQLLALYLLRYAVVQPGRLIFFDEPDNYVALREIQPWLTELLDQALQEGGPQLWIISHHPEVLNQLAPSYGALFLRPNGGPARVEVFSGDGALSAAELVARGWEGGE
jgi:energy-coupling factor transporter ATP-binding protein EcfA2